MTIRRHGTMLSPRALATAAQLALPFRFAPPQTYHPASNPDGLISFALASNALVLPAVAAVAACTPLREDVFTYGYSTAGGARLRSALAAHLNLSFNPCFEITSEHVQLASGATAVQHVLAFALASRGEGILTSRPVYGRFELDFGNEMGVEVVYAETTPENCFDADVVDRFEEAVARAAERGVKVRAVMIVNPNNPLGRCYPRETLVEIMKFCGRHRIHLISDEIYGLSVFSDDLTTFTSVLSITPEEGMIDPDLVHVEYGLAKDFAAPGLRLGALVSRNRALHDAFKSVVRFHSPAGPSVAIASTMLEDRAWHDEFIALSRGRLKGAYEFATGMLRSLGIDYLEANAGYFMYTNLGPWLPPKESGTDQEREFALAEKLVDNGVFLHPGEEHCLEPGWFRVVYSQDEGIVREGMRRIGQALNGLPWAAPKVNVQRFNVQGT
ncbi:1-aminocyclopropane-1-carboxylate synthase-like protein 1 [Colletotrichum fructicola]|uniref:1-aminocyclopropane-1-carboxylate synthase-like protein 1 n=1 Tax=Colletotrichum fructicola (strain Nara gc5) TaxID=1213859 RepID=A0A7J6JFU8_COLFN|nr:uncharacterized protein CGMCC3_g4612 [Colletotrichum fructicola]KAF4489197.1 1-aminocyclopropane-1-carboxylate synthase-like protein 1 [Colletotrichum fructicola Nara gc5]KAI8289278.1 hypothetical protein K4K60_009167 [Colletotrichum sp. SAR11_57]KAE9579444.1 hypothetical protein CGMCC3_g4612 [Colletotrichum fructicola]KAF4429859.1 1-aminocyclopropane-1-carboxylate synthase-like protein 1 [Colletotrichum fructicola]KAF4902644.1 1-aminocyclopropane-1-carboxylate synthase-like protein 1 [Coll